MKVALAGPPQSGKTENQPVIEASGWRFVNINATGDELRRAGGIMRHEFEALAPGVEILDSSGKRQAAYYMAVQRDPTLLERFTALELPHIITATRRALLDEGDAVLSWEQWDLLLPDVLQVDHVLFLETSRDVWIERLRKRATRRGYSGPPLPADVLLGLMNGSGFDPERMLDTLVRKLGSSHVTVVNTDFDWGNDAIRRALTTLKG